MINVRVRLLCNSENVEILLPEKFRIHATLYKQMEVASLVYMLHSISELKEN